MRDYPRIKLDDIRADWVDFAAAGIEDGSRHTLEVLRLVGMEDEVMTFGLGSTLDPTAPPLEEYLGPTGRLGIDLIAVQGDMEVIPGIQKFLIDCNWKFAVDNLFDWYHPQVTHMSAMASGIIPPDPTVTVDAGGAKKDTGEELPIPAGLGGSGVDEMTFLAEYGHAIGGPKRSSPGNVEYNGEWRDRPEAVAEMGDVGREVAGHPNIFPTAWITTTNQLSLRIPRGPMQTEIWWFTFADKNLTPEQRRGLVRNANRIFGPAGMLEQDDGENWAESTAQTYGLASRRIPQMVNMGLRRGRVAQGGAVRPAAGAGSRRRRLHRVRGRRRLGSVAGGDAGRARVPLRRPPSLEAGDALSPGRHRDRAQCRA